MGTYGKVDPIEISKGVENRFNFVAMDLTVFDDFLIRKAISNLCRPLIVAEKGNIRQSNLDAGVKPAYCQRYPTSLTPSADSNALRVDSRMSPGRFDGTHAIGEDTAVIIGLRMENTTGHKTGSLRVGAIRFAIGRIACAPGAALATGIHNKMAKAALLQVSQAKGKPLPPPYPIY